MKLNLVNVDKILKPDDLKKLLQNKMKYDFDLCPTDQLGDEECAAGYDEIYYLTFWSNDLKNVESVLKDCFDTGKYYKTSGEFENINEEYIDDFATGEEDDRKGIKAEFPVWFISEEVINILKIINEVEDSELKDAVSSCFAKRNSSTTDNVNIYGYIFDTVTLSYSKITLTNKKLNAGDDSTIIALDLKYRLYRPLIKIERYNDILSIKDMYPVWIAFKVISKDNLDIDDEYLIDMWIYQYLDDEDKVRDEFKNYKLKDFMTTEEHMIEIAGSLYEDTDGTKDKDSILKEFVSDYVLSRY